MKSENSMEAAAPKTDEMFMFEMDMVTSIKVDALDEFIVGLNIGEVEKQDLQEWRYLAERAYLEGQFDYAVAILRATTRASGYTCKFLGALPHARRRTAQLAASRHRAEYARGRKVTEGQSTMHDWDKVAKRVDGLRSAGVPEHKLASQIEEILGIPARTFRAWIKNKNGN